MVNFNSIYEIIMCRLHQFLTILLVAFLLFLSPSSAISPGLIKAMPVWAHTKVGIRKVALAQESISFPKLIPLLHGNSIMSFKSVGGHVSIFHSPKLKTQIFPLEGSKVTPLGSGFIFKESTLGTYPVPMENAMLLVRLLIPPPKRRKYVPAVLHISVFSHGHYTSLQRTKQNLFLKTLVKEFADNARRVLGVSHCGRFPTVSGLCNNRWNHVSGTSLENLLTPGNHKRPTTKVMLAMTPNCRHISNEIVASSNRNEAAFSTNMLFVIFGQLLDHEIVSTPAEHIDPEASAPIIDPETSLEMHFTRSGILRYQYKQCCGAHYDIGSMWKKPTFNRLTSYIDGGVVYGSSHLRATVLRRFKGGKIVMKRKGNEMFLPFNHPAHIAFAVKNEPRNHDRTLFAAGDSRANENIFLTSMHTLFAREHNRVCRLLASWVAKKRYRRAIFRSDEWLYQTAKLIVSAEIQSITYNEFLPRLLGENAIPRYVRYNHRVDARISSFHSSFAYRFGHSAIWDTFDILDQKGRVHPMSLKDGFFNTQKFLFFGVDNLMKAMIGSPAAAVDEQIIDVLRNTLFNPSGKHVLDLASLNINRLRDLGIPSYLRVQSMFKTGEGLNNIPSAIQVKLLKVYGRAEKIDAFIGGLSETPKNGSLLGPLFWEVNRDQFIRLRDGDRFYYQNVEWDRTIKDMPIVKKIREDKFRMVDVVLGNTNLDPSKFDIKESLFSTKVGRT